MCRDEAGRQVVFDDPDAEDAGIHRVRSFELALDLEFSAKLCFFGVRHGLGLGMALECFCKSRPRLRCKSAFEKELRFGAAFLVFQVE